MQNTFSFPTMRFGGFDARQGTAHFTSVNRTREYNPDSFYTTTQSAEALIRRSARVSVEFTKDAWKQFVGLKGNIFTAMVQAIVVKADMVLYITSHEEKGIHLDNMCQEICYEHGVFFLMKNVRGTWYVTEVYTTGEDAGFVPVYFWTRVKRGCNVLAARVLICWRRLTKRTRGNELIISGGQIND